MARSQKSRGSKDKKAADAPESATEPEDAPTPELALKSSVTATQLEEKAPEKVFKKTRRFVPNPERMMTLKEFVRGRGPLGEAFRVEVHLDKKRVVKNTLAEWQAMFDKFKAQPRR